MRADLWMNGMKRIGVRGWAVLISCLFSFIAVRSEGLLNDDAFGYLRAAELFGSDGVRAVLDNYGWYGYSLLIALLDGVLPGGLLQAAYLLNAATYALLVWIFVSLVSEYREGERVKLFAAAVILVFPLINEMRAMLVRDFAFWAFCLLALLQLVRYHRELRLAHALGWSLAMLAATFFRLEALVLLLLAPLSLLFNPDIAPARRLRGYLALQGILLAGLALVFLGSAAAGIDLPELIGYAYRYYLPRLLDLGAVLGDTAGRLNQAIFAPQNFPGNSGHGLIILLGAYLYTLLVNLINALGVPFSVLFLYGLATGRLRTPAHARLPALFFAGASLLSLLLFMAIMQFLTQRYAALASLVIISFLPLALDSLYLRAREIGRARRFGAVFGFFLFYLAVDSLISFGYSRRYVEDAVAWSRAELQTGARLYTNSYTIAYHSGRVPEYDKVNLDPTSYLWQLSPGDYLVAEVAHDEGDLKQALDANGGLKLLITFGNEREDEIRVYRAVAERR